MQFAGHAGVDPEGKTLRELRIMAEAKWYHTAKIEAAIRDYSTPRKDKKPWNPEAFNPFVKQKKQRRGMTVEEVRMLADACKRVRQVKASEVRIRENP